MISAFIGGLLIGAWAGSRVSDPLLSIILAGVALGSWSLLCLALHLP